MRRIDQYHMTGEEYFNEYLTMYYYTSSSFAEAYETQFGEDGISKNLIDSLRCGRRSFCNCHALTVYRIAFMIAPYTDETDHETIGRIIDILINGQDLKTEIE